MIEILQIQSMSYGSDAIARQNSGRTVFVSGAVPGDIVEVEITEEHERYACARTVRVQEPSPFRVQPRDPLLIASIEPWGMLSYEQQLLAKHTNVVEALVRNGGVQRERIDELVEPVVPAKQEYGYRNKLELSAFPGQDGRLSLGFSQHGSTEPIVVDSCSLAVRSIEKAPKALSGALRYMTGNDAQALGIYRVGVRASMRTHNLEVALWTPPSSFPRSFAAKMLEDSLGATSVVRVIAEPGSERKVKRVEVLAGSGYWEEDLAGLTFAISAPSFFQVNTEQAETLIQLVLELAKPSEDTVVADVFSGVGTFSLPLAEAGADVVAIELSGSAVRDLRRNAEMNDLYVDAVCDDAVRALDQLEGTDVVVVDPPRSGLDKEVLSGICEAGPDRVVYVSCDPQTLARDVARFEARGYHLQKCVPVDMFPQTYHVETVSLFSKA